MIGGGGLSARRVQGAGRVRSVLLSLGVLAAALPGSTPPPPGDRVSPPQGPPASHLPDSVALLREARDAQARFERTRVYHTPWGRTPAGGPCDEQVGRFCLRFMAGGDPDPPPPLHPPEAEGLTAARDVLERILDEAARELPGDDWIAGQRTFYRVDRGDYPGALEAARACESVTPGWCIFLEGYAQARAGGIAAADALFQEALSHLPPEEAHRLLDPEPLLEVEPARALRRLEGEDRERMAQAIWALGNPFALEGGNALRVEHLARQVQARIQAHARNPYGLSWGRDMEELLLRFGPEVAWERGREMGMTLAPPAVLGRFHPGALGLLPTLEAVQDPPRSVPGDFPLVRGGTRSVHPVPGVERLRPVEMTRGRVLRAGGPKLLVAWQLHPPAAWDSLPPPHPREGAVLLRRGAEDIPALIHPLEPGPPDSLPGAAMARGAALLDLPGDGGWLSVEFLDREASRGWSGRTGWTALPAPPDPTAILLSDLFFLQVPDRGPGAGEEGPGAPSPGEEGTPGAMERLEDHLDRVLASDTLDVRQVELAWEIYGVRPVGEPVVLSLTVERGERSVLRRLGEALRVVRRFEPVPVRWEEPPAQPDEAPPGMAVQFRRLLLELDGLPSGEWTVRLSLQGPPPWTGVEGDEGAPLTASRTFVLR